MTSNDMVGKFCGRSGLRVKILVGQHMSILETNFTKGQVGQDMRACSYHVEFLASKTSVKIVRQLGWSCGREDVWMTASQRSGEETGSWTEQGLW